MNHVNNNRRFGVQRITDAEASSSAMNYRCCYAIRPLKKNMVAGKLRLLMRHRGVRQDRRVGMQ
jgi:hypothetical protein